jgi:hypothetical protein
MEGEMVMKSEADGAPLARQLAERLSDSLEGGIPDGVRRRVFGSVALPGKATAVVGMRRAGKSTFLHQLRRERLKREDKSHFLSRLRDICYVLAADGLVVPPKGRTLYLFRQAAGVMMNTRQTHRW